MADIQHFKVPSQLAIEPEVGKGLCNPVSTYVNMLHGTAVLQPLHLLDLIPVHYQLLKRHETTEAFHDPYSVHAYVKHFKPLKPAEAHPHALYPIIRHFQLLQLCALLQVLNLLDVID